MAADYLFIGDDFTGASDTLGTLARAGRRTRLFLDPPEEAAIAAEALETVGIATELRAATATQIASALDRMMPKLRPLAGRIVHYKVCSTFDSSTDVGSIGAAVVTLEKHLEPALVAVIGGQPSLGRYCAFGNLFAKGPDGDVHRIDRHPVMRSHPTTPMGEGDLRRHLGAQGLADIALVAVPLLDEGAAAVTARIEAHVGAGNRRILFDACEQKHVETIGAALRAIGAGGRPTLIVGASSVAEALCGQGGAVEAPVVETGLERTGPCLVIAGSRSAVTAAQVAAASSFKHMPVRPSDLAGEQAIAAFGDECASVLASGRNVLVHLSPVENYGAGGVELARRLSQVTSAIVERAEIGMLGVAGGDTSSIVVRRLSFESLSFERRFDPGVAVCRARSARPDRDGMRLLLKGGQVGKPDIFDRFASLAG